MSQDRQFAHSLPAIGKTLTFFALNCFLCGCSVPAKAPTSAAPVAGQGTVLVRVSTAGLINMSSFGITAKAVGKDEKINFNGWSMASEGYWSKTNKNEVKGQLVAAQLVAGQYEFSTFNAINSAGLAMGTTTSVKPFSYPFQVRQGEVTYLGEIHLKFDQKKLPEKGTTVELPLQVVLRDTRAQDFQDVKKLIPDINTDQIVVRLLASMTPAKAK
jgi:hypothetical protein